MKGSIAVLAMVGLAAASPFPQAASGSTPAGCSSSKSGQFTITTVNVTKSAKRDLESRQLDGTLMLTLQDGILKDQAGRTGYIAANYQFQFDNPIQAGALVTSGWSACSNGSLALGSSAIFYQCLSGNFYNLYSVSQGKQCNPIYLETSGASSGSPSASISGMSDGQPVATTKAVSQISDGQVQATTATPAVSQISDGQVQATTAKPAVSQISDGQVQATTAKPAVSQISDGQVQATTAKPAVSQISDGQVQATTAAPAVSQISDGQVQATTAKPAVSQISDGQIQATTAAVATYTGAAAPRHVGNAMAFAAGIVGAVAML